MKKRKDFRERSLFSGGGGPVNLGGGLQFFGLPFGEGHLFLGPLPGRVTIFWAPGSLKKPLNFFFNFLSFERGL